MKLNQQRYDFDLMQPLPFYLSNRDVSNIYFALQYVNRQFMAETQFSSGEKEQVDEWTVETVEVRVFCIARLTFLC